MAIRRIHRTLVLEYVTDREDADLRVLTAFEFGASTIVSDEVTVIDADVEVRVAQVEALVVGELLSTADAEVVVDKRDEENS